MSLDGAVLAFGAYLLAVFGIGAYAARRTADLADYILGGRRLGPWTAGLSAGASDMSGWLLLGLPGYAYLAGLEAAWLAAGLLLGSWLNWRLLARPLREQTAARGDALTLPEFFARRFGDPRVRSLAAALILLFFTLYTAAGLVAGGKLFETVFGLPYHWAVGAGALTIVLYTLLGGFLAVSWTDVLQGLMMLAALLLVPALLLDGASLARLAAERPSLLDPLTGADGVALSGIALLSLLGWGLGYFGQPHILARFMAIRDPAALVTARRVAVGWAGLSLAGALLVGLTGAATLQDPLAGADSERVFLALVGGAFHPVIAGLLLAAILAAIMSTADSQLLVASSALAEDVYPAVRGRPASAAARVRLGRAGVLAIGAVAVLLAADPDSRVLELVAYAWAGLGAAFGPALLLALHWRRMTGAGALAGMLTGAAAVVLWRQLDGGRFGLYELVPGFALSAAAIAIVSRLSQAPGPAREAPQPQTRHP